MDLGTRYKRLWFNHDAETCSAEGESQLLAELDPVFDKITYLPPTHSSVMGFILNPMGYLPPTLPRPAYIYGHLPFDGMTQANDVFYRCEHWLTSRRVLLRTGKFFRALMDFQNQSFLSFLQGLLPLDATPYPICRRPVGVMKSGRR
jgi:hypothetical protein